MTGKEWSSGWEKVNSGGRRCRPNSVLAVRLTGVGKPSAIKFADSRVSLCPHG